jgi:hypothetical protein
MKITKEFLEKIKKENNILIFKLASIEGKIPKEIQDTLPKEVITNRL